MLPHGTLTGRLSAVCAFSVLKQRDHIRTVCPENFYKPETDVDPLHIWATTFHNVVRLANYATHSVRLKTVKHCRHQNECIISSQHKS